MQSSPNDLLAKGLRELQTAARSNYLKSSDLPARPRLSLPSTRQKHTGTVLGHVPHHLTVHQALGTDEEGKHQSPHVTRHALSPLPWQSFEMTMYEGEKIAMENNMSRGACGRALKEQHCRHSETLGH
jgi:hypothetical protein